VLGSPLRPLIIFTFQTLPTCQIAILEALKIYRHNDENKKRDATIERYIPHFPIKAQFAVGFSF
jgi:hypothetical protein